MIFVNIQSDLFWHRCLERKTFGTPRMYTLSPSKSIKGSNYGEFLKDKNVFLCTRLYKYTPNLESLLTQQYVCVMCTLWSDNTCVFTRLHSVKNANMQHIWSSEWYFVPNIITMHCSWFRKFYKDLLFPLCGTFPWLEFQWALIVRRTLYKHCYREKGRNFLNPQFTPTHKAVTVHIWTLSCQFIPGHKAVSSHLGIKLSQFKSGHTVVILHI